MRQVFITLCCFLALSLAAQESASPQQSSLAEQKVASSNSNSKSDTVYVKVDEPPMYPGGDDGLRSFISNKVKYPKKAQKDGVEGRVYVHFCVSKTGRVNQISILKGVHPLLDSAAIEVVRKMPKWTPGKIAGENVNVWYNVPINFKLQ